MNTQYVSNSSYTAWRKEAGPGVVAFGMWLRAGFVGASAVAVGLIQLSSGEVQPLSALALTAGGFVLAIFSWRRARMALDGLDDGTAPVDASSALRTRVVTS
jgi:hypothetical protein